MALLNNKVIFSLLINLFLFSIFVILAAPAYNTIDDVSMMHIASGIRNVGVPSEYLINSNILIGKALKFFFVHWGGFNWYTCYILLSHFLAMTTVLYIFLHKKPLFLGIILYFVLFVFLELPLLFSLQFTTTAFVVFTSGFLLFILTIEETEKWFSPAFIVAVILTALSGLIRYEAFYLAMVLVTPYLMIKCWQKKDLRILFYSAISITIFFAALSYNNSSYSQDTNWKAYKAFHAIRSKLHDYPAMDYNEKVKDTLKEIGWSKNDYDMLRAWFSFDKKVYSQNNLDYLAKKISVNRNWPEAIAVGKKCFNDNKLPLIITMLIIILFVFYGSRKQLIYIFASLAMSIIVVISLSVAAKLPDRVFLPIIFFLNSIALYSFDNWDEVKQNIQQKKTKLLFGCFIILFCIMLLTQLFFIYKTDQQNRIEADKFAAMIREINPSADQLYISWGSALRIRHFNPFISPLKYEHFNYVISGWTTNSPLNERIFNKFHLTDVYLGLIQNNNLYLVCNENNIKLLKIFMQEHYNVEISYKTINDFGKIKVIQIFSI